MLRLAQGASTYVVKSSGASGEKAFGEKTGIVAVKVGDFEVPTEANGQMWIRFTPESKERYLPAWKVLNGEIGADALEGRILIIGTSAAGLLDLRATPLDASVPGVSLHAQAIEQILQGSFLQRPDFATRRRAPLYPRARHAHRLSHLSPGRGRQRRARRRSPSPG